ncbi:MAG: hypothetical protein E2O82_05045 [Betaproteobacteria bacterium]|nr:MAG: hypothetical protein E2O82_05045 [Betaproteobacteria bacterium]
MLRDEVVDLIQKRNGNNTDETLRNDIINEMVQVQDSILEGDSISPWFLLTEESNAQTTVGDERVGLPADFLMPWEYGFLFRYDVSLDDPYIEMQREDWDLIKEALNSAGTPTHYDISGEYIFMRPVADEVFPLRMRYIARGLSLAGNYGTNNIENIWLKYASDWFIGEVGAIISEQYLQATSTKVDVFKAQATRGRERVRIKNVSIEESNKRRVIG